jgi:hypothetical protein
VRSCLACVLVFTLNNALGGLCDHCWSSPQSSPSVILSCLKRFKVKAGYSRALGLVWAGAVTTLTRLLWSQTVPSGGTKGNYSRLSRSRFLVGELDKHVYIQNEFTTSAKSIIILKVNQISHQTPLLQTWLSSVVEKKKNQASQLIKYFNVPAV